MQTKRRKSLQFDIATQILIEVAIASKPIPKQNQIKELFSFTRIKCYVGQQRVCVFLGDLCFIFEREISHFL